MLINWEHLFGDYLQCEWVKSRSECFLMTYYQNRNRILNERTFPFKNREITQTCWGQFRQHSNWCGVKVVYWKLEKELRQFFVFQRKEDLGKYRNSSLSSNLYNVVFAVNYFIYMNGWCPGAYQEPYIESKTAKNIFDSRSC